MLRWFEGATEKRKSMCKLLIFLFFQVINSPSRWLRSRTFQRLSGDVWLPLKSVPCQCRCQLPSTSKRLLLADPPRKAKQNFTICVFLKPFFIYLFEAVRSIDVVGSSIMTASSLSVQVSSGTEGASCLLPLLGHLKHVGSAMITLDCILDLVGATT